MSVVVNCCTIHDETHGTKHAYVHVYLFLKRDNASLYLGDGKLADSLGHTLLYLWDAVSKAAEQSLSTDNTQTLIQHCRVGGEGESGWRRKTEGEENALT